jgi:hypothetical protein
MFLENYKVYTYYNMYKSPNDYEEFTFIENFDIQDEINGNADKKRDLEKSIRELENEKRSNYLDISANIQHYNDKQNPLVLINQREPKDISYAMKKDVQELMVYQNSIYITGIIACASLIIGAILIAKK